MLILYTKSINTHEKINRVGLHNYYDIDMSLDFLMHFLKSDYAFFIQYYSYIPSFSKGITCILGPKMSKGSYALPQKTYPVFWLFLSVWRWLITPFTTFPLKVWLSSFPYPVMMISDSSKCS